MNAPLVRHNVRPLKIFFLSNADIEKFRIMKS